VYVKNFIHPVTRITLVVAAVLLGLQQAGIAGAYAIPYVLSAVVALYLLHRSLPASDATFDETITRDLLSYSLPMTVTDMAGFIYRNADIFLILWLLDSEAVAIYGVAYAAVKFMEMFSSAFNFLSTPVASELDDEGERADFFGVFTPVVRWLTIASICMLVPLGVFAEEFLTVIYGVKYGPGGAALVVLAIGFAIRNVLAIHGPILEGLGRSRLLMNNSLSTAVLNLGLNLVLIPRYGILGAAMATAASYFIRELLSAIEVWYIIGEVPVDWSAIGPAAVGSMLVGAFAVWVGPLVPGTFLWLVVASGAFSVVYLLVVLTLFGLSASEVMVIRSVEERFGLPLGPLNRVIRFFADE
jgi:O-antigen/teichoic acid export membrane protein